MHFFHALKRAKNVTVNGSSVRSFDWVDDEEDGLVLRVISEDESILIYSTDRISVAQADDEGHGCIIVSIGATDHKFIVA
jgi:hypothetical protein